MSDDDRRVLAAVHDDLGALTNAHSDGIVELGTLFDGIYTIREIIRQHLKAAALDD